MTCKRIISLVPSLTEALFAFGAGEKVIGRTRYCTLPPRLVRRAEIVGGTKKVDFEAALSLEPDFVVAVREENTKSDVERFCEAGVEVFVGEPQTVSGTLSMLRELAEAVGAADTSSIERAERVLERLGADGPERPARVFAPIWKNPYMSPGGDTYVSDVVEACGGANVFAGRTRYPEVTASEIEDAQPEVMLLPSEPYEFSAVDLAEFYALDVPAARLGRVHLIDGKLLTWYGPRMADALVQLARLIG
ncbi:helical backbone metal receptor [Rubrobacter indicoceani]|uniref:helical backbone metal receptor n=1 Tax=Rubrobacter indicoceani TaxID=2051957 RepID=UPI000E5B875B|nr:helical backbone metal receptor [Rubrobacter indicoceani]